MEDASSTHRTKAKAAVETVERVAERHADAIRTSLGKEKGDRLVDAPWIGHLPSFLRDFDGVPAAEAMREEWKDRLERHADEGVKRLKEHYRLVRQGKDVPDAFSKGVEAIRVGFLYPECADPELLERLEAWKKDAKKHKLSKRALEAYDEVVPAFLSGRKAGLADYARVNRSTD
jgi:hypothetical protein